MDEEGDIEVKPSSIHNRSAIVSHSFFLSLKVVFLENYNREAYLGAIEAIAGEKVFEKKANAKEVDAESGLTPAPIMLSEGIITNPATNDGYGLVHIEARHGKQIRENGYASVLDFIEEVAKNYEVIREGKNRNGEQTYLLQLTDKHNNTLMVELSGDGTYWNINTAGVFKTSYGRNNKVVYNRQTTAKQPAEAIETSQSVEQNGTQSPSSLIDAPTPNVPSENKGTTSVPNVQELKQKNNAITIAVFNNYQREDNRSVLTELQTKDGNFLVSLNVGKDQEIDWNIVATVFGKDGEKK